MIMFTTKMCHLTAVVLDEDVDSVTKELLKEGVLHFIKVTDVSDDIGSHVTNASPKVSQTKISETRKRIETFFNIINHTSTDIKELDVSKLTYVNIEESNSVLDELAVDIQKIRNKQKNFQQEIHKLEEIRRQLDLFSGLENIDLTERYMFLSIKVGTIPVEKEIEFVSELAPIPSIQIKLGEESKTETTLLITMKRDFERVGKILRKFEWKDMDFSGDFTNLGIKAVSEIDTKIIDLKEKQEKINDSAKQIVMSRKEILGELWANLRMNELFYRIQSFYSKTSKTMIFSGWLPASKKKALESEIISVTKSRCYLEWSDPKDIRKEKKLIPEVPVKLKNPKFLSPFEMLVKNYSIPEYGTVDPTPLVAIAYLIMFGLMFGDVGHGFVIFILGILGVFITRKDPGKESINKICQLMIWCSCAAMVTGVLFGSYFGYGWYRPLWFDYHGIVVGHPGSGVVKSINDVLMIAIYFGIAVLGLGFVLNWINCISKRNWFRLFLDKGGILGSWIYAAGVYIAFYFVKRNYKELPDGNLIFILIGIPAILLMLKPPIEFYLHNKKGHAKKFTIGTLIGFGMEWVTEMLEIFSGYLANTLSFMRIAGLGIAHVSLMVAFDQIAKIVTSDGSFNIWSYLILLAGNILVIVLEGLIAGLQSLRLNYYEFFSKYFSGTGKAYAPISLKGKV